MKNRSSKSARHEFILDRIEEDKAVLLDEDDQQTVIPAKLLPREITDGESVILTVCTADHDTAEREKKAKDILNEILANAEK